MMNRATELREQMMALNDQYDAGAITWKERWDAYGPLNKEYRELTGSPYISGRYVVNSFGLSVNHNRARMHGR